MKIDMSKINHKKVNLRFNILAVVSICIFVIGIVSKTLQNDTFYTIPLGRYVLEHGIDMIEHFSWHEGLIYTYPHWLYDIGIYLIYNHFGFLGIYISSIVLGAILGLSIYFIASKISKNNLISFFITILILFLGRGYITARAQLVSFILFTWAIYFIEKFLETKKVRYAVPLILIPIAIANIHAAVFPFYFILFLPYIGEYIVAIIADNKNFIFKILLKSDKREISKLLNKDKLNEKQKEKLKQYTNRVEINEKKLKEKEEQQKNGLVKPYKIIIERNNNVKWLILIMIICAFTGFLTPIGDTPYTYLVHTMQGNTTGNIGEHLPLTLFSSKDILILFAVILGSLILTDTKMKLHDFFMLFGLMLLSFMSRRQLSMFMFIGVYAINNMICGYIKMHSVEEDIEEAKAYIASIVGIILTVLIISALTFLFVFKAKDEKIVEPKSYPVKAADYILENLDVNNIKLFNDYNYGSYLMLRGIPEFIDSRADVYDPKFNKLEDDIFQDYMNIYSLRVYYEDKFDYYKITHVLTYKSSILSMYINKTSDYKELYSDDNFIIFERVKKENHKENKNE